MANGRVALVDDQDYELVMQYRWHAKGTRRPNGQMSGPYAATSMHEGGKCWTLRMHQLLTGWTETDHIDHNGLNNQRSNLRPATRGQNSCNSLPTPGGTSRYKGVSWDKQAGKWLAVIRPQRKRRYLGHHVTEEAAARAYDAAAREFFGEFAYLNFP
jgi:hypothetical protein